MTGHGSTVVNSKKKKYSRGFSLLVLVLNLMKDFVFFGQIYLNEVFSHNFGGKSHKTSYVKLLYSVTAKLVLKL